MNADRSEFAFALCNPGAEKALKLEVEALCLGWRPGYQRRGFVMFKIDQGVVPEALPATEIACARRLCVSHGKFASHQEACDFLYGHGVAAIHEVRHEDYRMKGIGGDDAAQVAVGDLVGTVVKLSESEYWAGLHRHGPELSRYPGGDSGVEMPVRSPSRAWLKLEEAARFFDLEFSKRDIVVELGCAPGGVVVALLERGISVIGVDPAKMADVVMQFAIEDRRETPQGRPWFYHCRKPAALVSKKDLGQDVTWFMSDMNQAPDVVLRECARFVKMSPSIRGVLITLKLTELGQVAEKPRWLEAMREMGFKTVRLQQLAVHHKEFALLGVERRTAVAEAKAVKTSKV